MLVLSREDVKAVLDMKVALGVLERAFRELAEGTAEMPTRIALDVREAPGTVLAMPAYLGETGALALKVASSYPDNLRKFDVPTVHATILYYDHDTGRRLALMEGSYITAIRTGATSGLATRYLARTDSRVVGIIGSGAQAETQLEAVCCVRSITTAKVNSRTPSHARSFADRMSAKLGIEVKHVDEARMAVEESDIIITATSATHEILKADWLSPGTHINAIGSHTRDARELDGATIQRSKVVVESVEAALQEAGDLLIPIKEGLITEEHIYAELGELVTGRKPGRTTEQEMTCFKSVGLAVEDASLAKVVYERAKALGRGTEAALS